MPVTITCAECGKERELAPSHLKRLKTKPTCSGTCRRLQMRGASHWNWKGGRFVTKRGYVKVIDPRRPPTSGKARKNPYVYEHVLVAEKHLGRRLRRDERIRHKDRDRGHNAWSNLQLYRVQRGRRRTKARAA